MTTYFVKAVYEKLCGELVGVIWDGAVWNRLGVPKHQFITWLAVQERLQTTVRLARCGISSTDQCQICANATEHHPRIFFECP